MAFLLQKEQSNLHQQAFWDMNMNEWILALLMCVCGGGEGKEVEASHLQEEDRRV